MSQKQEVKDILKSENVKINDISKIEFRYECTTPQLYDGVGFIMDTVDVMFTVSKEHFDLLINDKLTREEEAHFKSREAYEITQLIPQVLLNINEEWLNNKKNIKIKRVICIDTNDTSNPTIRIEKGKMDYPITDLDITNKKCRDMLLSIDLIKKNYANGQIVDIKDELIDYLLLRVSRIRWHLFQKLYLYEEQIEKYLYELTTALDVKKRIDLIKTCTPFRVYYVTKYLVKLQKSVKGQV